MALVRVTGEVIQQDAIGTAVDAHFSNTSGSLVITENNVTVNNVFTPRQVIESFSAITGATGTVTHNYSNGAIFYHTNIAGNFVPNITNVPTDNDKALLVLLVLIQGSTPYMPSSLQIDSNAETVNWSDGAAPSGSADKTDVVSFTMLRSNNTWLVLGQAGSFG